MTEDKKQPKTWRVPLALPEELKPGILEVAKRKDWSIAKTIKHAVAEYVKRELEA